MLNVKLRRLRLGHAASVLEAHHQAAINEKLGYLEFLERLVDDELATREHKGVDKRLRAAHFPVVETLEEFDFNFQPSLDAMRIKALASCEFVTKHETILFVGPPGCGKSHIAQGVGMAAIHAGFRVIYREAHVLFEEMVLATATGARAQAITAYCEVPLLIIDDVGMRKLPEAAAEDLLEIVMRRYERASTIITSNRPLDDWPKLFGDTPAVAAFLDRMMHHSHLIEIRGKSYRLHESSLAARRRKVQTSA